MQLPKEHFTMIANVRTDLSNSMCITVAPVSSALGICNHTELLQHKNIVRQKIRLPGLKFENKNFTLKQTNVSPHVTKDRQAGRHC